jgi:superfamily I DNA/RNA helicase
MSTGCGGEDKYTKAKIERQKYVDAILRSPARKKIVVAGPGTGKTFLFSKVLEGKKNTLTLTFINSLVEDLSLELCGLSDVKTLHSFARSTLAASTGKKIPIFPLLSQVIKKDAAILLKDDVDFDRIFHDRDDGNKRIEFYVKRRLYYDNYYGYSDIVFEIVRQFEADRRKVPTYEQVVVDEFQDFNRLEVSLIELLAEKSPVLLAGDDDQALYDFKRASTEYIRQRHTGPGSKYVAFNLPLCSRCTRVVVAAANDVISTALKNGHLKGRINKPYLYFDDLRKDRESEAYPNISYGAFFAAQIPWFIEQQLDQIAHDVKRLFSVLVISPTKTQSRTIVNALKAKGLENIRFAEKRERRELSLIDGLKLLLENRNGNLGWRIAAEHLLDQKDFESLLKTTDSDGAQPIGKTATAPLKREVAEMLKVLRAIREDEKIDREILAQLAVKIGFDPHEATREVIKDEIASSFQKIGKPSIRKIPVRATTIQSSKGLAAEYVFITHFDDQYFIKHKDKTQITDQDICNFLVALTRAKRKVFLISSDAKKTPTFLKWIHGDRIAAV